MKSESKFVKLFNELSVLVLMGLPVLGWFSACSHKDEPKDNKSMQEKVMKISEKKAEQAVSSEEAAKYWEKYMEAKEQVYCSGLSK